MPPWGHIVNPDQPICGFFFIHQEERCWLPLTKLRTHTSILSSTSRTTLTQTFVLPSEHEGPAVSSHVKAKLNPWCRGIPSTIPELRYAFPLYDGVSVVGFTCTINDDRTITGVVKERAEAKEKFDAAVAKGQTAGLLEQDLSAGDVFTTTVGNVPAGAKVEVNITYVGELKHDAEVDGLRLTIPTRIAPRYGNHGKVAGTIEGGESIEILVDAEMAANSSIKSIQSPSHPVSIAIGTTSTNPEQSLSRASATLALRTATLEKDFVLQVVASNLGDPSAVIETHPTLGTKALMATLVPKFNLQPAELPEVVFVCDRSGSMTSNMDHLVAALRIFLKSLPVGIRFNICSFGSHHDFLFDRSEVYTKESLGRAMTHLENFHANYGGTEMYQPIEDTFKRRYKDLPLEVFVLTDGEIWAQDQLFDLINKEVAAAKGSIRLFSLGVGSGASTSLVEGIARAGNGFSQMVADGEAMDRKVVRMLKGALTAHVDDYQLEVKWASDSTDEDGFELIEKVESCLSVASSGSSDQDQDTKDTKEAEPKQQANISLFDPKADTDAPIKPSTSGSGRPSVAQPKILQAPHKIPPLFPFNRTTVYLVLSGSAAQKVPTSVVLRGTSAHGPLSLEIPVKDNGKGETIAQLAARKAVKELEEGRGWLYHATDKDSGKLLKEEYDAKFKDVVQREAVRLGVDYGVGGKWCSFVALEKDGDEEKQTEADVMRQQDMIPQATLFGGGLRGGGAMPRMMMASMATPAAAPRAASAGVFGSAPKRKSVGGGAADGGVFGSAPVAELASFGGSSHGPGSSQGSIFGGSSHGTLFGASQVRCGGPPPPAYAPKSFASPSPAPASPEKPLSTRNALDKVIELQDFDGAWQWSDELAKVIGVDEEKIKKQVSGGAVDDFVVTCMVMAWLEKKYAESKDSWEMVVDKARNWAAQKGDVEQVVGELVGLF